MNRIAAKGTLGLLALAVALSGHAQDQRGANGGATAGNVASVSSISLLPATMPFQIWGGMIVVKAAISDGLPHSAVLDTSLPICLIAPVIAARQNFQPERYEELPLLYGVPRVGYVKPQPMHLDRLTLTDVPIAVCDPLKLLSAKQPPDPPLIWIGNAALAACPVTIDPLRREVTFRPANSLPPRGAILVPFEWKDGRLWIEARANGSLSFRALLDTSAMGTLLPADTGRALKLIPTVLLAAKHPNGKEGKMAAVQLDELALGDLKVNDVQAIYFAEGDSGGMDTGTARIGLDVLLRYRITIFYGQRRIAFEAIQPPPAAPPPAAPKPKTARKGEKPR